MRSSPWLAKYDAGIPANLVYPAIPLHGLLRQAASRFPQRACTIYRDHSVTYKEMDILTDRLASALVAMGLQPGERVGLMMPNLPQFVLCFYAILKAGGVVVAINPQYRPHELVFQLNNAGVTWMMALTASRPVLTETLPQTGVTRVVYSKLEDACHLAWMACPPIKKSTKLRSHALRLDDLLARDWHASLPQVSPDDAAIFQYSGGTTGAPKAAVGLHRNLVANTVQFSTWLSGLQEGHEVVLAAIPLFHVYGMVIAMSMGIALAASIVTAPDARNIEEILHNIQTYRATLFPGVPNMYHAINHHPEVLAGHYDLRSIKGCISGSAPLRKEVKDQFEALTGGKLLEGYGLSEAPTATHCNPMWGENRTGSIGLPLPDVECRIVDAENDRKTLKAGEAGELLIRGPQIMQGYYQMADESREALKDGWLHTGDVARMDKDGYFYLVGRKKDLIKIGGFQVWPSEVEEVLAGHPAVLEVAVAGVETAEVPEAVKAWVVLRPGASLTLEELRAWCHQSLVHYKAPTMLEFRSELPRSTVGKILRRELVRQHQESSGKISR